MTNNRFMDFDALDAAEAEEGEEAPAPPQFKLGGVIFDCLPKPKATAIGRLTKSADQEVDALIQYLKSLVVEEQRGKFEEVLESDKKIVDLDKIGKMITWVSEAYAGRPTAKS